MNSMRIIIVITLLLGTSCAYAASQTDSCSAQIPPQLAAKISSAFPGYRTPLERDNLPEDIEYDRKAGGTGCLGVATADFDGDGIKDFLLALTPLKGVTPIAVVALTRTDNWSFFTIRSWVENRVRLYTRAVPPGHYERSEALDGPVAEGERESLQCSHSGAEVGATESTGIVYCYVNGTWLYVWVSD